MVDHSDEVEFSHGWLLSKYNWVWHVIWFFFHSEEVSKEGQIASDAELGVQFTEIFIKNEENISVLLSLLEVQVFNYYMLSSLLCILVSRKTVLFFRFRNTTFMYDGQLSDFWPSFWKTVATSFSNVFLSIPWVRWL